MKKLILLAFVITPLLSNAQNFPYPVIFVHGLSGDDSTWDAMYSYLRNLGWTYGGELPFCLNYDGNNFTSNLSNDYRDFVVESRYGNADFYIITFDVDRNGNKYNGGNSNLSNQSGIVKQGRAIKDAIQHVMNITGKNRVILFAHSMGGLAAREYLQNPSKWISPNSYHHVAKLVTAGTPHGGSNADNIFTELLTSIDTESEALRDLRTSYKRSQLPGVYLFGGKEQYNVMDDDDDEDFYNIDVNCNGQIGDNIIGLNQKTLPTNLDLSFIISNYYSLVTPGNSDGVVGIREADLTNYYILCAERFYSTGAHSTDLKRYTFGTSLALPDDGFNNLTALDEPDFLNIAYEVEVNRGYNGYFSTQGDDNCDIIPKNTDYDSYVFEIEHPGFVQLYFTNLQAANAEVNLYNYDQDALQRTRANNSRIISQSIFLQPGYYYADLQGNVNNSHLTTYQFQIFYNRQTTDVEEVEEKTTITIFPNPVSEKLYLSNAAVITNFRITDLSGRELQRGAYTPDGIDVLLLPAGMYIISMELNNGNILTEKFSKF